MAENALAAGLDPGTRGDRFQVVVHVDAPLLREVGPAQGTAPTPRSFGVPETPPYLEDLLAPDCEALWRLIRKQDVPGGWAHPSPRRGGEWYSPGGAMPSIASAGFPMTVSLRMGSELRLSDDELFDLCARNPELRIERTAAGDLIVMTPAGGASGHR
ncbi:MAG TPA: Uma2 family endonuclease, partial [Thermoanaerobaculia bacterium]|nr:Uma2 family endonuclease [Thermoanaerobaculia bacterium]